MNNPLFFTQIHPYHQTIMGKHYWETAEQLQSKLDLFKTFKLHDKKSISLHQRCQTALILSNLLKKNRTMLAEQIVEDMGKCIADALFEVDRATLTIQSYVSAAGQLEGKSYRHDAFHLDSAKGSLPPNPNEKKFAFSAYVPYGVVLAITPFNFPINLALHKIIPSFLMGNQTLLKPNPQCYSSTKTLVELCREAGLGPSMLEIILPDIPLLESLIRSDNIDLISFTGGLATAQKISQGAGIKKQIYELGGNDALVIYPDAAIDLAAQALVVHRFKIGGQRCTSAKKIFIHHEIKNEFVAKVIEKMNQLKIGDPKNYGTDIGPLVDIKSTQLAQQRLQQALDCGAKILHQLKSEQENNSKIVFMPTLIDEVPVTCDLVAKETFAPIAPLFYFSTNEELIEQINHSRLGLQCGIFTNQLDRMKLLAEEISVGSVIFNEGPAFRLDHLPFGGFRESGYGREGGMSGLLEYGSTKTIIF